MVDSLNTPFYAVTEQIGADTVRDTGARRWASPRSTRASRRMVDAKGDPKPGRTRSDIAIGRYPVTPGRPGHASTPPSPPAAYGTTGTSSSRASGPDGARALDGRAAARSGCSTPGRRGRRLDGARRGGPRRQRGPGRPAAGKTGTQQWGNTRDNQDAWMAGYTPELATAVWIGKAKPGPIRETRPASRSRARRCRRGCGATSPATRCGVSRSPPLPRPAHGRAYRRRGRGPRPPSPVPVGEKKPAVWTCQSCTPPARASGWR